MVGKYYLSSWRIVGMGEEMTNNTTWTTIHVGKGHQPLHWFCQVCTLFESHTLVV